MKQAVKGRGCCTIAAMQLHATSSEPHSSEVIVN